MNVGPYETGRVYQGDCLELMKAIPDGAVDAVICDPPYSSGGMFRGDRARDVAAKYGTERQYEDFSGDNKDSRSWKNWCLEWLRLCQKSLTQGGYVLVFTDWRQLPTLTDLFQWSGLVWRGIIAWDKGRSSRAPHKGYFRHQCEYVVWGTRGPTPIAEHDGPFDGCYSIPIIPSEKEHMTAKPEALMSELVRIVPPDSVILDPFAGSGTTGVACARMGREFLGVELDEHWCKVANDRIDGVRSGLTPRDVARGQLSLIDLFDGE